MGYTYTGQTVDLGHGRGWLDADAAASIRRIDAQLGHPLQVTEAGRSFFQQEQHWLRYLRDGKPIALNPNTPSVHQKGRAIDSDEAQRIVAIMHDHGWRQTVYRNGKLVEPWHWEYDRNLDNHYGEETDMALNAETDYPAFSAMMWRFLKYEGRPNGLGATFQNGPTFHERFAALNAADAQQTASLSAIAKAVSEMSAGQITPDSLERISAAAKDGAEAAIEAKYRAQIAGLEAQLEAMKKDE